MLANREQKHKITLPGKLSRENETRIKENTMFIDKWVKRKKKCEL